MKKFRSSKLLKPVDPQTKEEAALRMKIKQLQQQIDLLQKSNLNIFIPLSQHPTQPTTNYEAIINKLKVQIVNLQKENQNHKASIRKLQRQKQQIKIVHQQEIKRFQEEISQMIEENGQLKEEIQTLQEKFQQKKAFCQKIEKQLIEKNIQLKFLHQDFYQAKLKIKQIQDKLSNTTSLISAVIYSSRIYKSKQKKMICIERDEYQQLKDKITQLEQRIRELIQANQRDLVKLGVRKSDVGEQIVRLKKNIDLQLGLEGESRHSQEFLKIYKGTNELFAKLISECRT